MASGRGRDGGRALSGPDLPLAALSPIAARPHPGTRRHHLWIPEPGPLPSVSAAAGPPPPPPPPRGGGQPPLALPPLAPPLPPLFSPRMACLDSAQRAGNAARDPGVG